MVRAALNTNKPLAYALLSGTSYFLLFWATKSHPDLGPLFYGLMLFLPGLTFPLLTCYFDSVTEELNSNRELLHLGLSVVIYHASVWIFSGEARHKFITLLAGAFGSLLFLVATKIVLHKCLSTNQLIAASLLSALAFAPFELLGKSVLLSGFAVMLWTIINGWVLNTAYKASLVSTSNSSRAN